jgi:hypothetical protein
MPSTAFRNRVLCNQVRPEHFDLAISRDSNRSRPSDPVNPVAVVNVQTTYSAPVIGQFCPFSGVTQKLPHEPKWLVTSPRA